MEDQVAGIKGERCQLLTFRFVQLKNGLKRVLAKCYSSLPDSVALWALRWGPGHL